MKLMNVETIWAEYQTSLKAFLYKNVNNTADVEDLLQEILIKTYQNLSTVKEVTKIKPWLFQIAQHSIIDFYRQQGRNNSLGDDPLWYEHQESSIHQQLSQCILPFIESLEEDDKQLLTAIEINGISQKEYALQHNIKYSTLKSRVQKSRQTLQSVFTQCCNFNLDAQGHLLDYQRKPKNCNDC